MSVVENRVVCSHRTYRYWLWFRSAIISIQSVILVVLNVRIYSNHTLWRTSKFGFWETLFFCSF